MIPAHNLRRATRSIRAVAVSHLFAVGQAVRVKDGFGRPSQAADPYRITAILPPRGDLLQYRIRNDEESHERVTTQDNLEPILASPSGDGATFIEGTLENGQRTEAQ